MPIFLGIYPYDLGSLPSKIYVKSLFIVIVDVTYFDILYLLFSRSLLVNTSTSLLLSKSIGSIKFIESFINALLIVSSRKVSVAKLGEEFISINQHFFDESMIIS